MLLAEAAALEALAARLGEAFASAVALLGACRGRVVLAGVGKSGLVARKIAATLTSTGTPAFFVHPTDGLHGDLGIVSADDVVVVVSKSGATPELGGLLAFAGRHRLPIVALTGVADSPARRAGGRGARLRGLDRSVSAGADADIFDHCGDGDGRRARDGTARAERPRSGRLRARPPGRIPR